MHHFDLKEKFLNLPLSSKLKYIYTFLILFCLLSNIVILRLFFTEEVRRTVSALTSQTIETVSNNVDNSLTNIAKTSTYLLGNTDVQNYLESTSYSEYAILSKQLRNSLYLSLESMPLVSSILIVKPSGIYEGAARYTLPSILMDSPEDADWYEELWAKKGAPIYITNADEYLSFEDGGGYISLIRLVNSTEDARFLGYMIINISADSLFAFAREGNDSYSDFYVASESDTHTLLPFLHDDLNEWIRNPSVSSPDSKNILSLNHNRYFLLKFQDFKYNWLYITAINYNNFTSQHRPFLIIYAIMLAVSTAFFMLIAFFTNRFLTTPLRNLMKAMKATEGGSFVHADIVPYNDEIGQLQNVYNEMVDKIQALLSAKVTEQKTLRKAELNVLQEQIKPHFLYNSLGAISYLVTAGQNEKAYELLLALSEYYRESLSKGSTVISLESEINIVKNYLKLQKIRFPEAFNDEYDLQKECLSCEIPRLILQPLVENALYHGLIPSGEFGYIKIRADMDEKHLVLSVADNGIGMTETELQNIMAEKLKENQKSFGLRGTVERMQIFYETHDIYSIKSEPGMGTTVTFYIPKDKLEQKHEYAET